MYRKLAGESRLSVCSDARDESLDSIATDVEETHWELKQLINVKGGGVLKKYHRSDDPESLLYDLVSPDGKRIMLQKYRNCKSVQFYDASTQKMRYLSKQSEDE